MDEHHYTALDQDMHNDTSLCLDRGTPAMHVAHSTWKRWHSPCAVPISEVVKVTERSCCTVAEPSIRLMVTTAGPCCSNTVTMVSENPMRIASVSSA